MSKQPDATRQGSADRAEELRGLSDYELGQQREVCRGFARLAHDSRDAEAKARFAAEGKAIAAEWNRRCAEREAQEAELERLREAARLVLDAYEDQVVRGSVGDQLAAAAARAMLTSVLSDEPQPQEASEGQEGSDV